MRGEEWEAEVTSSSARVNVRRTGVPFGNDSRLNASLPAHRLELVNSARTVNVLVGVNRKFQAIVRAGRPTGQNPQVAAVTVHDAGLNRAKTCFASYDEHAKERRSAPLEHDLQTVNARHAPETAQKFSWLQS